MTSGAQVQNAVTDFVAGEDRLKHVNGNAQGAVLTDGGAVKTWAGIRRDAQAHIDAADDAESLAEAYRRALAAMETAAGVAGIAAQKRRRSDNTIWGASAGFGGVGIVADGNTLLENRADAVISAIEIELQPGVTAARLALTIISRTTSDMDNAPPPGGPNGPVASGDILATAEFALADVGLTAGGAMQSVMLPLPSPIAVRAGKTYIAVVEAKTSGGALAVLGFGQAIVSPALPARLNGFYRPSATNTAWGGNPPSGYAAAASWVLAEHSPLMQFDTDIGHLKTFMAKVDRSFAQSFRSISSRAGDGTFWHASENHFRWTYGISAGSDVPVGSLIARVASFFELSSGITKVRLIAWSRPTTALQARSYPSAGHGDTELFAVEKTIAELDIQAMPGSLQRVSFPVGEITVEAGTTYLFQWEFQNDAGANQAVGIARRERAPDLSQQQRGWYDNHQPLSSPLALTWELDKYVYVLPGDTKKVIADTRDTIADATAAATGLAVTLNGIFRRLGSDIAFSGSLTLDTPVGGTVADEVHTITEAPAPHRLFAGPGVLAHSNVSKIVVKDAETNATLVAGTDYLLDTASGGVCLPAGQSDRVVKVSYTWSERRYDMLCIHAETMRLVVVRGIGRERDAGEFLPRPDDSALMPLFYARVATGFDTVLVPLWYLDGPVHRDLLQIRAADFEQARAALRKTLAKAHAGQPIVVAAMGDSILAQQSDIVSTASPNGPYRDRTRFFLENIGPDKVAELTLYDNGDGAGQVHIRASKAWAAVRALAQWGSTVTYNNFANAGTWSGNGTGCGADPLLRAAVWAIKPDVLFIQYGMNEIGSGGIEANLRNLIERAFAHGIEVLVFGCPRPSATNFEWTFPELRKIWRATRRAATGYSTAYRMRAAYYDPARLVEEDYVGAMGLAPIDFCSANGWNHPGVHEHEVDCAEIQAMLCG